tara:strand:- start:452 stop:1198 length:747 start_codon:yes stop_codon:yes gene_type:complete
MPAPAEEAVTQEVTQEATTETVEAAQEPTTEAAETTETAEAPALPDMQTEPSFESTGNEYADQALAELDKAGVDLSAAFGDWIETGDVSKINVDAIAEKLGPAAAQGIVAGLTAEANKEALAVEQAHELVYDAAGGKEAWDKIIEWVGSGKSGLTEEGHAAYNAMLKAGGTQATLAVRELSNMFQQSPGFTQTTNLVQGDAAAQARSLEPISRAEYASEYSNIVRDEGESSPKLQALDERRLATMNRA